MRLLELDARFIVRTEQGWREVHDLDGAQGVMFQCPKCAEGKKTGEEDGRRFVRGAHYVICWFMKPRGVEQIPDDAWPGPGRWEVAGSSLDDLSFVGPAAASVGLQGGCRWHGFVRNGAAA